MSLRKMLDEKRKNERKFVIQVFNNRVSVGYIREIYKNQIGLFYIITHKVTNASVWKYRKNCLNTIEQLNEELDPTKKHLQKYNLDILEITDNQILRKIKLRKFKN